MTASLSSLLAITISCFYLSTIAAQTASLQADPHPHFVPKNPEMIYLSDFGLYESYQAEAEGIGTALIVKKGGIASQAGLQTGAILTAINDKPVRNFRELRQALATVSKAAPVRLRYLFENQEQEINLECSPPITRLYSFQLAACYGLEVDNFQKSENGGVLVTGIPEQKNDAAAQLQVDDIIIEVGKYPVSTWSELYEYLRSTGTNRPVELTVLRRGQSLLLSLNTLNCQPAPGTNPYLEHNLLGIQQSFEWIPGANQPEGILIGGIMINSPAALAGLKPGDRLLDVEGITVLNPISFMQAIANQKPNQQIQFRILRDGHPQQINIGLPAAFTEAASVSNWNEENTLQPKVFRVFPNPTSGLFNLEFEAANAPVSIRLFNMNGSLLFSEQADNFEGAYHRQFDFRGTPPGPLVVRIEQKGKVFSKVVLVE